MSGRVMPIMLPERESWGRLPRGAVRVRQIPWDLFGEAERRQCDRNHGQTPERLAERGGLSACEAIAVLSCQPWRELDNEYAHRVLYAMQAFLARGKLLAARPAPAPAQGEG